MSSIFFQKFKTLLVQGTYLNFRNFFKLKKHEMHETYYPFKAQLVNGSSKNILVALHIFFIEM